MLAERLSEEPQRFAEGWNFGPQDADAKPVAWIADELVRSWGEGASWTRDNAMHLPEAHALKLDPSKAKSLLNWYPVLPLNSALSWVVEWYRAFQARSDLGGLTRAQIARYEALTS